MESERIIKLLVKFVMEEIKGRSIVYLIYIGKKYILEKTKAIISDQCLEVIINKAYLEIESRLNFPGSITTGGSIYLAGELNLHVKHYPRKV